MTAGYLSSFTPVHILDGSNLVDVRTHQTTVDGAIRDAGIALRPEDVVEPPLGAVLVRNQNIVVQRARLVRVLIDGKEPRMMHTQRTNARDLLGDAGYGVGLNDAIKVNGIFVESIPLAAAPIALTGQAVSVGREGGAASPVEALVAEIEVHRAVPLSIEELDSPIRELKTTAATVGEALLQAGQIMYLADRIEPALGAPIMADMKITIQRAKPATVWVDGRAVRTRTHSRTVADLLAEMNVILLENDYTKPGLDTPVTVGSEIRVVRVSRSVQISQQQTDFETRWEASNALEIDTQGLGQEGESGVREVRDAVVFEDGLEVKRERVADFTARPVKDRIYNYGTQIVVRSLNTASGPVQYWRKITMRATSYSASTAGVSRSVSWYGKARCGQTMRHGIVAVDPRLIPLGSTVFVEGYGVGFACDTGSAILGKRIDLGYGDDDLEWWNKTVDVYVLTPVPPAPRYRID